MLRRARTSAALALLAAMGMIPAGAQTGVAGRRVVVQERATGDTDIRPSEADTTPAPAPGQNGVRALAGAKHAIPLWGGNKHLIVRATLNGALTGPMLVDTGASYCVLTRAAARKLGVAKHRTGSVPVATANGQVTADLVTLASLQIADARVTGLDAVVMDAVEPPLIGIIGLSFLNHFRYSVDHGEGTIQLER